MAYTISAEQQKFFEEKGYLILRDILNSEETKNLQQWAQEVHDLPRTSETPWMPYEEINASGKRVLCRTENYANYHPHFNALLRGEKLLSILGQLAKEPMLLFKEKINYKLASSGGFSPHVDSVAYTHVKDIKHLTILLAVDPSNTTNGGLDVVEGSHLVDVPFNESDHCITDSWVKSNKWVPVELEAGEILIFGSYLAHRSGPNNSTSDRKAIYATYNCKTEGDLHDEYYLDRAKLWPATHKRQAGVNYEEGALRYGFGSPMLSVDLGKQFVV